MGKLNRVTRYLGLNDAVLSYRQHSPCLASANNDLETCLLRSVLAIARLNSEEEANDGGGEEAANDMILILCRFQVIFRSCLINAVDEKCGNETAKYLDTLFNILLEELIEAKCIHVVMQG
ncbi:hypothetical protein NPIL_143881 [Nephila pilipes]|uniref:Uncharacterized protein n=1 Tax=Nephila pilipes TaxID=299642 RepID=A0A8X6MPI1_NEPPI|nr:hypothetical protein NPIL_143881 [Nephila pilipes]